MTGRYLLDPIPDLSSKKGTLRDDADSCGSTSKSVGCRFDSCQGRKCAGQRPELSAMLALTDPRGAVRFARLTHRRVRDFGRSSAGAACGGNLNLPWLLGKVAEARHMARSIEVRGNGGLLTFILFVLLRDAYREHPSCPAGGCAVGQGDDHDASHHTLLVLRLLLAAVASPAVPGLAQSSQPAAAQPAVGVQADCNQDGFADLAIGAPGEAVGTIELAGEVNVLYGTAGGLNGTGSQLFTQVGGAGSEYLGGSRCPPRGARSRRPAR